MRSTPCKAQHSLLQTQSSLVAADANLQALREVDRTTEQYVQEKTALGYQSTGIKAQVAQAELQQITLQDTYETQKENLNSSHKIFTEKYKYTDPSFLHSLMCGGISSRKV